MIDFELHIQKIIAFLTLPFFKGTRQEVSRINKPFYENSLPYVAIEIKFKGTFCLGDGSWVLYRDGWAKYFEIVKKTAIMSRGMLLWRLQEYYTIIVFRALLRLL